MGKESLYKCPGHMTKMATMPIYDTFPVESCKISVIMPPTLKKLEGHIAFGLSVCLCVRPLTFER